MKVTKEQQQHIRAWGLIEAAEKRLARCRSQGDQRGIDYNAHLIAKYKAMLEARPIPDPQSIADQPNVGEL